MCTRAHVCSLNTAGFRSLIPLLWEKREARIKNERVQSSEVRTVFVRVNLFIREISIEMILVTDLPRISLMADTQNVYVYVYRTCEESRKGRQCNKERGSF